MMLVQCGDDVSDSVFAMLVRCCCIAGTRVLPRGFSWRHGIGDSPAVKPAGIAPRLITPLRICLQRLATCLPQAGKYIPSSTTQHPKRRTLFYPRTAQQAKKTGKPHNNSPSCCIPNGYNRTNEANPKDSHLPVGFSSKTKRPWAALASFASGPLISQIRNLDRKWLKNPTHSTRFH
jgi:hypothetical protein